MSVVDSRDTVSGAHPLERARELVGGPTGEVRVGRDPVNLAMVHHWCQALEDHNPAYLDAAHADASARGELIAPPGMLQTWTMDAPRSDDGDQADFMRCLDDAGYTSVVAVNYEHEYRRELRHGERISVRSAVEDLSAEKRTALGDGVFTTARHEYLTDDGEIVGIGRMRLLKFRPPVTEAADEPAPAGPQATQAPQARALPPVGLDNQYFWDGVALGELRIQRCTGCGVLRHPPQPLCATCGSTDQSHVVATGRGAVYSFIVHHGPPLPGVTTPHTVLLVELEEGLRFVSELADGVDPAEVRIGLPVELDIKQLPDGQRRPAFRPTASPTHSEEQRR